jgi:hypothetical protein
MQSLASCPLVQMAKLHMKSNFSLQNFSSLFSNEVKAKQLPKPANQCGAVQTNGLDLGQFLRLSSVQRN